MTNGLDVVSIRLVKDAPILSEKPIRSPEDAVKLLGEHLCELDREVVCVINLKSRGVPINCNFVSMGALNQTLAHPREILKSSILSNAASMLILHNHPSGSLYPGREDCMLTDRLLQICDLMGIPLLDHIIVGGENELYFSFKEQDMLEFKSNDYCTDYKDIIFPEVAVGETKPVRHRVR